MDPVSNHICKYNIRGYGGFREAKICGKSALSGKEYCSVHEDIKYTLIRNSMMRLVAIEVPICSPKVSDM